MMCEGNYYYNHRQIELPALIELISFFNTFTSEDARSFSSRVNSDFTVDDFIPSSILRDNLEFWGSFG
jgi:hypothetical protein